MQPGGPYFRLGDQEKSLTEREFQNWFARFRPRDFDLKDAPRSGRPTELDDDKIKAMIENNRHSTTRQIAEKLNMSHTCIERHLKQLDYVNKLDIWVPHKLNDIKLTKRISICDSLMERNKTDPFLKRIITGDEKWVFYDNVVRKGHGSSDMSLRNRHQKPIFIKRRLC